MSPRMACLDSVDYAAALDLCHQLPPPAIPMRHATLLKAHVVPEPALDGVHAIFLVLFHLRLRMCTQLMELSLSLHKLFSHIVLASGVVLGMMTVAHRFRRECGLFFLSVLRSAAFFLTLTKNNLFLQSSSVGSVAHWSS